MYKITYTFNNPLFPESYRFREYTAKTVEKAAERLILLSIDYPISDMKFGNQKYFSAKTKKQCIFKKEEQRCKVCGNRINFRGKEWCKISDRWCLDYSIEELSNMIRKELPDGGLVEALCYMPCP